MIQNHWVQILKWSLTAGAFIAVTACQEPRYEGKDVPNQRDVDRSFPGPTNPVQPPPNSNLQTGTGADSPGGEGQHVVTGVGKN